MIIVFGLTSGTYVDLTPTGMMWHLLSFTIPHRLLPHMAWFFLVQLLSIHPLFSLFSFPAVSYARTLNLRLRRDPSFDIEVQCSEPGSSSAWWLPLQEADSKSRDPCQIHQDMKDKDVLTACCFGDAKAPLTHGECGPCTLETYNIVAACLACTDNTLSSELIPDIGNDTRYHISIDNKQSVPIRFPSHSEFDQGRRKISLDLFALPPWTKASLNEDFFNASAAIDIAQPESSSSVTTSSASSSSSRRSSSSTSPTSSKPTSLPSATSSSSTASVQTHSKAGIIAGAAIGGVVLVGAILFLVVFIRRRQRAKRMISEQNRDDPSKELRRRLSNLETSIIAAREEMQVLIESVGNSRGRPGSSVAATNNVQSLTQTTEVESTTGSVSNPSTQREGRAMDAGPVSMDSIREAEEHTSPPHYADVFEGSPTNHSRPVT